MTATTGPAFRSVGEATLYVSFELGAARWKLAVTSGFGVAPWVRTIPSGDLEAVMRVVTQARQRFAVDVQAPVVSCYEAGRDGFWIHRALTAIGITNRVVDSASIEVNRRARRLKTDRIDALKLVMMLVRVSSGERGVWHEVRVPTEAEEAARHVSRERQRLMQDHTRIINQVRGCLATWGCAMPTRRPTGWWTTVRDWNDAALPAEVQARIARAMTRLTLIEEQVATIEAAQETAVAAGTVDSPLTRLLRLKTLGTTSASVLLDEGLVWRRFRNRREVGAMLGYTPTAYQSGESTREQGISRAGNPRWQAISVQLAWQWVKWQVDSPITRWFHERFAQGGARLRRIGIVAVARRLLITLWRYATTGVVPAGAILKAA